MAFIPKDKQQAGILLEFKTTDNIADLSIKAHEALEQIKDKQYTDVFSHNAIVSVLALGIAFCGRQLDIASEIINLPD